MAGVTERLGNRRIGLEQEFFLVDGEGVLSHRADEFLARYREVARAAGRDPEGFAPECAACMVEMNTPAVYSFAQLSREYLEGLELALEAGRELGLRLYPLATYPLRARTVVRDEPRYRLQEKTVGPERFAHAGRCAGVHLHFEVEPGTIDLRVGVSYEASEEARQELLNLYNLATALDPALVALTRSCPFYDGKTSGLATRTTHYRGHPDLAPHGLYALMEEVGGLRPYANSTEELVEQQFSRYYAWLWAMDRAEVERRSFFELCGGLLAASWNPVRLNRHGTIELRGMDSNLPGTVLAVAAMAHGAARRVRRDRLAVFPQEELRAFKATGDALFVPGFECLRELLHAAIFRGIESPEIVPYLDSVLEFSSSAPELGEEICPGA